MVSFTYNISKLINTVTWETCITGWLSHRTSRNDYCTARKDEK